MTALHEHYATPHPHAPTIDRNGDRGYRRRRIARQLRPLAQAIAMVTVAVLFVAVIWLCLVVIAHLPI